MVRDVGWAHAVVPWRDVHVLLLLVSAHYHPCMEWAVLQVIGVAVFGALMGAVLVLLIPARTLLRQVRRRRVALTLTQLMLVVAVLEVLMGLKASNAMATTGWLLNVLATIALNMMALALLKMTRSQLKEFARNLLLTHPVTTSGAPAGSPSPRRETPAADRGGPRVPG